MDTYLKSKRWTVYLLIAMASLLVYANTLGHGFVWDDRYLIEENPHIKGVESIPSYFVSSKQQGSYDMKVYRPLRQSMFAVEYRFFGLNPMGYHVVNIILHALNAIILLLFFEALGFQFTLAAIMAVLYAVHPVNTEVVANITGRADILFTAFYLLGIILYLKAEGSGGRKFLLACAGAFILSLLSKEMAITFPLAIVITEFYGNCGRIRKERMAFIGSLFLLLGVYLIIRQLAIGEAGQGTYYGDSFLVTLFSETRVVFNYIRLFLAPYPLSVRYDIKLIDTFLNPYTIGFVTMISALLWRTIDCLRGKSFPLYLYGAWWFFITLLPVSNLIPIRSTMMGERYLYIMVTGLLIFAFSFHKNIPVKFNKPLAFAVICICIIFSALTIDRNRVWKSNITLFEDAKLKAPDSLVVRWNLFNEYDSLGDRKSAYREFMEMKRINLLNAGRHLDIARKYEARGKVDDAIRMAERALKTKPDFEDAIIFLRTLEKYPE